MQSDDLFERAKLFTEEVGGISVSSLQRKFLIGHTQAETLLKQLIKDNICESYFVQGQGYILKKLLK
ncbi:DNA translocase FtsK [Acinetobacter sp. Marseille-Q1623]|uniref:DNA translocase FtsK n=1 Tax=Acinetobacter sp. Marseille-Q1623 TaxID=2697501 RepID=UPI00157A6E58|nr:DNA translocase FtsK [Acinetobacter sp. Marseille-Q1623]